LAGSLCLCCFKPGHTTQGSARSGCILYGTDPGQAQDALPGLARMDFSQDHENGLVWVLKQLSDVLDLSPAFGMYDDGEESPNAAASWKVLLPATAGAPLSGGTVAVGRQLVKVLKEKPVNEKPVNLGSALTAICAHEYGHILQFKFIYADLAKLPSAGVRTELHADFVCGYFGAFRKQVQPTYDAATQAETQFRLGDGKYKRVSHGTPEQRGDAVYQGFLLGLEGKINPKDLAARGLEYVRGLRL